MPPGLNVGAVTPLAQSISFTSAAPVSAIVGGTYFVAATGGGSGNAVTFSSLTPSVCTLSGSIVSLVSVGSCTAAADQAGGDGYLPATQAMQSFIVHGTQTITFTSAPPSPALLGATYAVAVTGGGSGNAIVFSSSTPLVCSVANAVVSLINVGNCTIAANQAAGGNYLAAPEQTQSFAVVTPAQATQNLITTITGIGLPPAVANSLSAPLGNLNTSNLNAACGKLNAFISQVNSKVQNGQLTTSQATPLLSAANAIKASLGCP